MRAHVSRSRTNNPVIELLHDIIIAMNLFIVDTQVHDGNLGEVTDTIFQEKSLLD